MATIDADSDGKNDFALAVTYSVDILEQTGSPYGPDAATWAKASALALVSVLASLAWANPLKAHDSVDPLALFKRPAVHGILTT